MSSDTSWGSSQIFSGKLEKNNGRSMGLIFNRGGLQTRVHSETPSIWDEGNNSAQKEFRYFKCRSGRIIKKRCYRKSTSKREGMRFLQHLLSSSQEERKNGPSSKRLCRMRGIIGASLRLEHVTVAFHCLAITQRSF